jgi:hypothetical protein
MITEQIKGELLAISPSVRREYLLALKEYFPAQERPEPGNNGSPEDPKLIARGLVRRLISILPTLDSKTARELTEELEKAGFLQFSAGDDLLDAQLLGRLGLNPGEKLPPMRLGELSELLIDFAGEIDSLTWSFWARIAPGSSVRPEPLKSQFRQSIRRFLQGDKDLPAVQLKRALDKTRALLAGIFSGLTFFAERYAKKHLETFAPERIRASIGAGNSGMRLGVEQKCWKRYASLALGLNGPAIESQINHAIVLETEAAVARKSGGRNTAA